MKGLLILLALLPAMLQAGTLTVTWTPPTTCSDGSPISGCAVTGYNLYSASCSVGSPVPSPLSGTPVATTAPAATSFAFTNTPIGTTWCITAQATSAGGNSDQSVVAVGTVKGGPGAPSIQLSPVTLKTTGTTSSPVYLATQIPDGWAVTQVGTVPVGTPCDPTQGVNSYNVVPQATGVVVTWLTAVHPLSLLAICQ